MTCVRAGHYPQPDSEAEMDAQLHSRGAVILGPDGEPVASGTACEPSAVSRSKSVQVTRKSNDHRSKLPLWVRALEAWVEGQYPIGRHGYAEARAVVEQVKAHFRQAARLVAK